MNLKIFLPSRIFMEMTGVSRVVVETSEGSIGFLEHRLDCVAAVVPGILIYEAHAGEPVYVAVDEGAVVKTGSDVLISVRHAIAGTDLSQLHETVKMQFLKIDEQERNVRAAVARMDGDLIRRVAELQHAR